MLNITNNKNNQRLEAKNSGKHTKDGVSKAIVYTRNKYKHGKQLTSYEAIKHTITIKDFKLIQDFICGNIFVE